MVSGKSLPAVVYRLGHLGDVALLTGVLDHWREERGLSFVVATRSPNSPLLEHHPAVSEVIALEDADLKGGAWFAKSRELAARFRGHPLIDLHDTLRSRILSLVWKGKVSRYPKFSITRRLFAKTRSARFRATLEALNVPQRYALALDATPPDMASVAPRLFFSTEEIETAQKRLAPLTRERPLVALHPYATHPAKEWPRGHWLNLTALLASEGYDWVVVGRDKAPLLPGNDRDLTNGTNLRETCAILSQADLLVTSDSGPMHLGTGAGTPVIGLFGPTAKAWGFFPSGPQDTVLELEMPCRPCSLHGGRPCESGHRCMAAMEPEMVMQAVCEKLSRNIR
ncbi:glycosyltransferase family 9 protein [Pseudodesulfovibrio sp.]|uniref:glycosyltransferase family 9 protein n=1 Tax=unclassified Pseudodesulfovibrio TaxID=2661612 RepID=UPI003B004F7A